MSKPSTLIVLILIDYFNNLYDRLKIYFAVSIYWIEQKYLNNIIDGGNADTIKMLLDRGANPNTQGQFKRTPLYRAAFAGHLEACQVNLKYYQIGICDLNILTLFLRFVDVRLWFYCATVAVKWD